MAEYVAPPQDDRIIWDLWLTANYQAAIVASDEKNLFGLLDEVPATIAELAVRLDSDERATGILVRLLAALGLVTQTSGRFELSEVARIYLVRSSPYYWGHMMRVGVSEWHLKTLLLKLKQKAAVRGPENAPSVTGEGRISDGWASGNVTLEQAEGVAARMHSHSLPAAIGAARSYDFGGIRRVLDVGGGSGCFAIAMAQQHPHLRCTILELSAMCDVAKTYIEAGKVASRVDTRAIDMFREPWPKGYDAIFFSNIWHDWSFETCRWLARQAFDVLAPGGRILLHEMLLNDDGTGPPTTASFSMLMLLATQGQQFTFGESRAIMQDAGFVRIETKKTYGYYSITTGHKPSP